MQAARPSLLRILAVLAASVAALRSSAAPSPKDTVKTVQVMLFALGYRPSLLGNLDGRTEMAIRSYEEAEGLPKDGIVTPYLLLRLAETLSEKCTSPQAVVPAPSTPMPSQPVQQSPQRLPGISDSESTLVEHCRDRWPTDYEMQSYCQKQQRQALTALATSAPLDIPPASFATIRSHCATRWPTDFEMRAYCEQQQIQGYHDAHR